ncbi:MAG: plasmid stabilization protein [Spirochaetae bacterium HGW-Spirochaetae-5]|nr:MAG: plasmid stabilization protein [Spirochaetae bacterium HGW-Spirochaetae-5]
MKVFFLPTAQFELDDAVEWYNEQSQGLGIKFLDDLDRSIRRVIAYPLSSPELDPGLRRCLLTRFPFGVIYGIDNETIVVIAVAHLHRKPRYWCERLE